MQISLRHLHPQSDLNPRQAIDPRPTETNYCN